MGQQPAAAASGTERAAGSSVLRDSLVIAAAERRREPELPAATVAAALAAPLPDETARYDLILPHAAAGHVARLAALADGFVAAGHRVFRPGVGDASSDALGALRRTEGIEAAAVVVPDERWEAAARHVRADWSWRVLAAEPNAGAEPLPPWADARLGSGDDRREVDRVVRAAFPRASVAVVTYDNLAFSRLCLESVLANTEYPSYELIVVDNGSTDGTPEYLRRLAARFPHVRPIFNDANRGFGPANNQALAVAAGEILVLLNNDTMTPRGWLTRLARHLADPALGMIGPATNRTCNEAQVEAPYATYGAFVRFARERAAGHDGERRPIRMPMMFCAALRRDVYERVGPLDERYAVGMFEDEDYALRVKAAGYATAWAPDVYVHHAYHASIGKLLPSGDYTALFKANQRRFEEKWGICWERHRPPA